MPLANESAISPPVEVPATKSTRSSQPWRPGSAQRRCRTIAGMTPRTPPPSMVTIRETATTSPLCSAPFRGSWAPVFKRSAPVVDLHAMERDFVSLVDQLVEQVHAAGAEIRVRREAAPRLDAATAQVLVDAYVAALRAEGWLREVDDERLEGILDVRVVTDDGSVALDVDSAV